MGAGRAAPTTDIAAENILASFFSSVAHKYFNA